MAVSARNIELRQLRYFVAVVDFRSFRGAAGYLNLSQPPLTRQIQQLEELLGAELLVRKTKGLELTDAGRILYEEARQILARVDRALTDTALAGEGKLGQLGVGIFGSAIIDIIPRMIRKFREEHPNVEVVMYNLDRQAQIAALRENRISVGFNRFFASMPDLAWEVVQTERLVIAVPSDHPLASRREIALRELIDEALILYPRVVPPAGFSDYIMRTFQSRFDAAPHVIQEVTDAVTAVAFVSSGLGLSPVLESMQNLHIPGVIYVPLLEADRIESDLCMIVRKDNRSPLLNAFLRVVRDFCQHHGSYSARNGHRRK